MSEEWYLPPDGCPECSCLTQPCEVRTSEGKGIYLCEGCGVSWRCWWDRGFLRKAQWFPEHNGCFGSRACSSCGMALTVVECEEGQFKEWLCGKCGGEGLARPKDGIRKTFVLHEGRLDGFAFSLWESPEQPTVPPPGVKVDAIFYRSTGEVDPHGREILRAARGSS